MTCNGANPRECAAEDLRQRLTAAERLLLESAVKLTAPSGIRQRPDFADNLVARIAAHFDSGAPEQCPECGMKDSFDGMWHKPGCSKPSRDSEFDRQQKGWPYG